MQLLSSLQLVASAVGVLVSAAGLWTTLQRYRQEQVRKELAYSVDKTGGKITVSNSGNTSIEPEDYISPIGFYFGRGIQISEAYVKNEVPQDLGVAIESTDSGRLVLSPIYLNPGDRFTLSVSLKSPHIGREELGENPWEWVHPQPSGRVRGTHQLFKEEKYAPPQDQRMQRESPSAPTRAPAPTPTRATFPLRTLLLIGAWVFGLLLFLFILLILAIAA